MSFQYQGYISRLYSEDLCNGIWITAYSDVKSNHNEYDIGVELVVSGLEDKQTRISLKKLNPTKKLSIQDKINRVKDKIIHSEEKVKVCGVKMHIYIEYIIRDDDNVYVEVIGLGNA